VAQAQHGSAPDIAGKGLANPTSLILSAAGLLSWRGHKDGDAQLAAAAAAIEIAIDRTLANPQTRTCDIGGACGTDDFARAVVAELAR
jgi:isocitrate/isopropylmalate dehydrogenase